VFGVRIIKMQSRYVVGDEVVVFRDFSFFLLSQRVVNTGKTKASGLYHSTRDQKQDIT
jgi:hypothetical protein